MEKWNTFMQRIRNNDGVESAVYFTNKNDKTMSDDGNIATTWVYNIYPSHIHQGAEKK